MIDHAENYRRMLNSTLGFLAQVLLAVQWRNAESKQRAEDTFSKMRLDFQRYIYAENEKDIETCERIVSEMTTGATAPDKTAEVLNVAHAIIHDYTQAASELKELNKSLREFMGKAGYIVPAESACFSPDRHFDRLDKYSAQLKAFNEQSPGGEGGK